MKIHTIDTGFFKLDGGAMFGVVPKSIWQKLNPPDADNLCTWAMRCLLIEDGNKLILIDCGLGNKQSEKFFSHYQPHGESSLEKSLHKLGFTYNDITDVVLTHLHFDHCGGAVYYNGDKLTPSFPNATYWSNEKHWIWATKPNAREKASFLSENILPIAESGQLKFLNENENCHNISCIWVHGHTQAMMLPIIQTKQGKIMFMADLLPSAAHIPLPYVMAYDTQPLITLQEKATILEQCVKENITLVFEHDKDYEAAQLQEDANGKITIAQKGNLVEFGF